MTVDQRVQWITLPAGAAPGGNGLRLSVVVAPRLRTDKGTTLTLFPDFLDWPAKIREARFAVRVGAASVAATVASEPPDSALWTALFRPETSLAPFVFDDYADRPFVTYSVGDVLGALRTVYARVAAAAPDDLPHVQGRGNVEPPVRGLLDLFDDLRAVTRGPLHRGVQNGDQRAQPVGRLLEEARRQAAQRRLPGAARGGPLLEPLPPDGTVARHFERALLFHVRPGGQPVALPPDGQHYTATVDFHQMLAALGDHPWLLRRLGLIVDLVVGAADIPGATIAAPAELAVQPAWTSALAGASVDVLPHTAYAHQRVSYRVVATTPFREHFPPEWLTQPDLLTRTSSPREVDVPSSAPPATPKVLYAVPTLGWEASGNGGATVRRRRGGLRVYLERPWFSSGDGELLGVVVGGALTSPKADDYPYITLVGQDPVRGGAPLEFATPATFRNAAVVTEPLQPLEWPGRVTIAAFQPVYDAGTQRWFCDIGLDTRDTYLPFVRLALVRYQPHSLSGCALSRIVLADIVQTLPDRTLTVTRAPEGPEALQISVAGPSYTAIRSVGAPRSDDPALARMVARLEQRDAAIPDDLLGWRAVDGAEVELTRALAGVAATWTGRLPLPPGAGTPRRLVVVEEEHLAVDEQTPGQGGLGARVVYADTLEV